MSNMIGTPQTQKMLTSKVTPNYINGKSDDIRVNQDSIIGETSFAQENAQTLGENTQE